MIALTPTRSSGLPPSEDARLIRIAMALAQSGDFEQHSRLYRQLIPRSFRHTSSRSLQVDDTSEIAHMHKLEGLKYYAGRSLTRAREGDWVAIPYPAVKGYADYRAEYLGLGRSSCLSMDADSQGAFEGLLEDKRHLGKIAEDIRAAREPFWIHPYMGIELAWRTGLELAERSKTDVKVLAPLPPMTRWANDKVWFAKTVRRVLGAEAALESREGRTPREVVRHLRHLARTSKILCLKLANSASGMGTSIFEASAIGEDEPQTELFVAKWLKEFSWKPGDPAVSVERWETKTVGSPSIQLWIPPKEDGWPLMEGIFDQLFYPGQQQVFLGSIPSRLPHLLQNRLSEAGVRLGRLFQHLGYIGRCSFDTILCSAVPGEATIRFAECNGRWGGTSTPMTLMNRLFGDYRSRPYLARDFQDSRLQGITFPAFQEALKDILYDRRTAQGWAIVYNIGCLEPVGKLDVITLGSDWDEARHRHETFAELIELRF